MAGCGAATPSTTTTSKVPPDYRPIPVGRGALYRLPAVSGRVARRQPIDGLPCSKTRPPSYGVHLELYGRGLVVPVPAGIGIAPPQRRRGAYILGGACWYPVRTYEPTGVVVVDAGRTPTLGTLFNVWGQPLKRGRLAGFRGPVTAFVAGRRWTGAPRSIPLTRHAQIVLVRGGHVIPHPAYRFPPGR